MGPDSIRFGLKFRKALYSSWQHTKTHCRSPAGFPDAWTTSRKWKHNERSPFEKMRVLEPPVDDQIVDKMIRRFQSRFTNARDVRVTHSWAGMIDATPDLVPVIDKVPDHPNFWIATGFSGHGFGIGPVIGRILSDLLQGKPADHDMSRFRFSRLSDGSPIVPGPSL
jgi:glycine/D-amino acid oxidase-like deaminating enzyme